MSSLVDRIIAQVLQLEVGLRHACIRLRDRSDSEALHDLRTQSRRLRSLLRPMRSLEGTATLEQAAAAVGRLTTPARDLQVLLEELTAPDLQQAAARRIELEASLERIARSPELNLLFEALQRWPVTFRELERRGELEALASRVSRRLQRQLKRLRAALEDPAHDRHQLRLQVKRTRYLLNAYPDFSPLGKSAEQTLKAVQGSLGDWHDRHQMVLRAGLQEDLAPFAPRWAEEAALQMSLAELQLKALASAL
jgi:CHAD domain-containing protein